MSGLSGYGLAACLRAATPGTRLAAYHEIWVTPQAEQDVALDLPKLATERLRHGLARVLAEDGCTDYLAFGPVRVDAAHAAELWAALGDTWWRVDGWPPDLVLYCAAAEVPA